MDIKSAEKRSQNMAAIKSKDTTPELLIRRQLFKRGFRYRLHSGKLPGKPDLFLPKYSTAVFINGCFWHQHPSCKEAYMPKSNTDKWKTKLTANVIRDEKRVGQLISQDYRVLVVWECTIKKSIKSVVTLELMMQEIEYFLKHEDIPFKEL